MAGRKRREPDLLAYTDFREYLRDYYAFRKSQDRGFSYGVFARRAGIPVRWHLKGVLDYGRNLTPDTQGKYRKALGLTGPRGEYFSLLVALNQAQDEEGREAAKAALRRWRKEHVWKRLSVPEAYEIYAHWSRVLIQCIHTCPGFREDPAWISRRLLGAVSPAEAADALAFLKRWRPPTDATFEDPSDSESESDFIARFRGRLYRAAGRRRNRRMGYGRSGNQYTVFLTQAQAVELDRKLRLWIQANLPEPSRTPGAELCAVLTDVFALSGPA